MARVSLIRLRRAEMAAAADAAPAEPGTTPPAPVVISTDERERPGLGLPDDAYTKHDAAFFPSAVVPDSWKSNTLTVRERAMLAFVNRITDKSGWETKVFDEEIVGKWKTEMAALVAAGTHPFENGFSDAMYDWCIRELRDKAKLYEKHGIVSVLDAAAAVFKSDVAVPADLKAELRAAVAPLEDVPEDEKDWHPGSDGRVLDIVHPSLWPLVYGKSRIRTDREISLDEALAAMGSGEVIAPPNLPVEPARFGLRAFRTVSRPYSTKFQWLPAEVELTPDGTHRFTSYINNLHPVEHRTLYGVLERLLDKAMPMLHATYDRVMSYEKGVNSLSRNRIVCLNSNRKCTLEDCEGCQKYSYAPLRAFWDGQGSDNDEDGLMAEAGAWFDQTHPVQQPEPKGYKYVGYGDYKLSAPWFTNADGTPRRLQVIVKLATIHLTPEKPTYDGGSWHIEGQLNERICATALYYYDSANVVDTRLEFRTPADAEDMQSVYGYDQGDHEPFRNIFGQSAQFNESTLQQHGDVLTREGRLVVFPNVYQHHVERFTLLDATKPGHRKIVAFFLVDPATPVLSTANVPPQQRHWEATTSALLASKLPPEISQIITSQVDCPYGLDEAVRFREELIDERKALDEMSTQLMDYAEWNFCEH